MSIERIPRKRGTGWRVRWRDGTRNRARTFDRKADAVAYEAEVRRRRRAGDLRPLDAGRETLQEFIAKSQELPGIKQSAHEHHARIVAALRQRNPEKARRAMRAHLSTCEQAFTLLGKISGHGERTSLGLEK